MFWGAIKLMVLSAFYAVASTAPPMTFREVVAYVWLGQALLGLLPWNLDEELAQQVRSGGVAYELLRPLDLYAFWFARTLAFRTARSSLRALPMAAVAGALLPVLGLSRYALAPPPTAASGAAFLLSLGATVLLATAINMLLHVSLLSTLSGVGMTQIAPAVVVLLSGMIIPLPFFPDWLQPLLQAQPLRGLVDVPFRIYTGHIPPAAALREIAEQLAWAALIAAAGRIWLGFATRRVALQGG
jgi:ABC-2 type transport system permease protein